MLQILFLWLFGLSVVTFAVYGWDKAQAQRAARRVPERSLHLLAVAGGFVGGWLGMFVFHHKTRKPVFKVVLAVSTVAWAAITVWLVR